MRKISIPAIGAVLAIGVFATRNPVGGLVALGLLVVGFGAYALATTRDPDWREKVHRKELERQEIEALLDLQRRQRRI